MEGDVARASRPYGRAVPAPEMVGPDGSCARRGLGWWDARASGAEWPAGQHRACVPARGASVTTTWPGVCPRSAGQAPEEGAAGGGMLPAGRSSASLPACSLSICLALARSTLKVTASPTAKADSEDSPFLSTSVELVTV